jgi:4-hydroxy-4-methyl-2-oxoglutarate aldolase
MQDLLVSLGAATVAESGGQPLAVGLRPVWAGASIAGPAFPVRCVAGDNLTVHHGVTSAPAGSVLVVAVDGGEELGWWGEVLTVAATTRGIVGLVIDACVRDTRAIADRRFGVWASGVALPGAAKVTVGSVGDRIRIRGVDVERGDWVVADDDGIAVIAEATLDTVVTAARARAAKEAEMFASLAGGATTVELLGLAPLR